MLSLPSWILWPHPTPSSTFPTSSVWPYRADYRENRSTATCCISIDRMLQGLPSSDRYCDNIPPPLRRGRISPQIQKIGDICGLHPFVSGSAFLFESLITTQQCSLHVTDCYLATLFPEVLLTASALELPPILGICYMAFWCYHGRTLTCKHLSAWLGTP